MLKFFRGFDTYSWAMLGIIGVYAVVLAIQVLTEVVT